MITKEGKKIWSSPAGGNLMKAMLGVTPMTDEDRQTALALRKLNEQQINGQRPTDQLEESKQEVEHHQTDITNLKPK